MRRAYASILFPNLYCCKRSGRLYSSVRTFTWCFIAHLKKAYRYRSLPLICRIRQTYTQSTLPSQILRSIL